MAGDNPIDEGIVNIKMLFTTGEAPGKGLDPVIDKTKKAEKNVNDLERGVEHLKTKLSGSWLGKVNDAVATIGGLGMGALGIGAIADGLGNLSNKAMEAAMHAEDVRDKLSASIWLLKSQGLVEGPEDFAAAMGVARKEMAGFRQMAAEGIGDPSRYADAFGKLGRGILLAGGSVEDVQDFTRTLVPLTELYGEQVIGTAANLLALKKKIRTEDLAIFNLSRDQIKDWTTGAEVLEAMRASMTGLRPIGEDLAQDLGSKTQKAHDATAKAWKDAGEVWAPVLSGMSKLSAEAMAGVGHYLYLAVGGGDKKVAAEWESLHPGEEASTWNPMNVYAMEEEIKAHREAAGALKATGNHLDMLGKEVDDASAEAAGGLGAVADAATSAAKEFDKFISGFGQMRGGYMTGEQSIADRARHSDPNLLGAGPGGWTERTGLPMEMAKNMKIVQAAQARERALAEGMQTPELESAWQRAVKTVLMNETAPGKAALKAQEVLDGIAKSYAKAVEGRGAIHIGQVVQNIDTKHLEPARVARMVRDELVKAAQFPTGSKMSPAFGTHG